MLLAARQNATSVSRVGGRGHTDDLLPCVRRLLAITSRAATLLSCWIKPLVSCPPAERQSASQGLPRTDQAAVRPQSGPHDRGQLHLATRLQPAANPPPLASGSPPPQEPRRGVCGSP